MGQPCARAALVVRTEPRDAVVLVPGAALVSGAVASTLGGSIGDVAAAR